MKKTVEVLVRESRIYSKSNYSTACHLCGSRLADDCKLYLWLDNVRLMDHWFYRRQRYRDKGVNQVEYPTSTRKKGKRGTAEE